MIERDETRERFLGAIAERIEPDDIAEAHLFTPIRQGGTESGVAVIAVNHHAIPGPEGVADGGSPTGGEADTQNHVGRRLTVYTAKYRLTLKGPERGKWDFSLNAEADAPLLTIDKVVRGVRQRSGDAEDAVKLDGEEFRALLPSAEKSADG